MRLKFPHWTLIPAVALALGLAAPVLSQTTDTAADPVAETPPPLPPPLPTAPEPATPPPLPPQPTFYIDQNGTPGGPFKLAELQTLVAAGTLTPTTLAWTDGMAEWSAAGGVVGLETLFAAPPVADVPVDPVAPVADLATFVVGNWLQTGAVEIPGVGPGNANLAASFGADGTFTIGGVIEATNAETGTMRIQVDALGNYTIQPLGPDQFAVTQTGSAKMTIPGFAPVEQPVAETTNYRMIDANTIEDMATGDRLVRQP